MPDAIYEKTTLSNIGQRICDLLKVKGSIVLTLNEDDTIGFTSSGLTHAKANELLSVGIHINLGQHDDAVRAGAAGKVAQGVQRALDGGGR